MEEKVNTPKKTSETAYELFKQEAELFFVKKFITGNAIDNSYRFCLDVVFGLDMVPDRDYARGLIIFSKNYGQGKSFFFDVIAHRCKRVENRNLFMKTTAKELVNYCVEHGEEELKKYISVKNLYIDDIGDEGKEKTFQIKKSKNMINVLRAVLLYRYEMFIEKGWRTFGTTNLTIEEIGYQYDGRLADRLKQMVHWHEIKPFTSDKSFRQYAGTRVLTRQEIDANWRKLNPPKKQEGRPDLTKYMNDLVNESDEYIREMGWTNWRFVKSYLLEKGIIKETDFIFDEETLQHAAFVLRQDTLDYVKLNYKHTNREVRIAEKERGLAKLGTEEVNEMAATILAKQVFMNMRENKIVF